MESGRGHRGDDRRQRGDGLNHGTIGALISAWPAVALVGSFELAMMLTRNAATPVQPRTSAEQSPEEAVLAHYLASLEGPGRPLSQRHLAEKHGIDRRKVKQIIAAARHLIDEGQRRGWVR